LRERDVHWLIATDADYPRRLAQAPWSAPPVLFTRGNEDLFDIPAVALLNSADAPSRALDLTDALADRLAAQGVAVVSGHNTRGYKAAAVAAVRHGAPRLLVLDRGLISAPVEALDREPVVPARVWTPEWDALAGLAVAPFRPQDGWTRANSRRRDEIVASLASGLVAVHVRSGGVMAAIAHTACSHGMWLGVCDGADAEGNEALLASEPRGVTRLAAADGLDVLAERVAEAVREGAGGVAARGRAARRWAERERQFLYSLLEAAFEGLLETRQFLDFGDRERWPPEPARPAAAVTAAVCDATGLRDARAALLGGLEALAPGGWLAALLDERALAGDANMRPWLAAQGWVAATIALPARADGTGHAALLLRPKTAMLRSVLTVSPETTVADAAAQQRYFTEARRRVRDHLNLPPAA
jgi:DNA recombination-mediator protein A